MDLARIVATVALAVSVLLVGLVAASNLQTGDARPAGPAATSEAEQVISRDEAMAAARNQPRFVRRVDQIAAKLVTAGELRDLEIRTGPDHRLVWLVAINGELVPEFGQIDIRHSWGLFVLDSRSAAILESRGGTTGTWPSAFDRLVDRAN